MNELKKFKISDFLTRIKNPVAINKDHVYKRVTIRMYHKGVVLRDIVNGSKIGSKVLFSIKPGQFILSGIDARNAAFGIVPDELDGAVVTNDFWVFDINKKLIDVNYFYWLTSTPQFLNICRKASLGTTNRQRIQADLFYNFEVGLPIISEQQRVVKLINICTNLNQKIEEAQRNVSLLIQSVLSHTLSDKEL